MSPAKSYSDTDWLSALGRLKFSPHVPTSVPMVRFAQTASSAESVVSSAESAVSSAGGVTPSVSVDSAVSPVSFSGVAAGVVEGGVDTFTDIVSE